MAHSLPTKKWQSRALVAHACNPPWEAKWTGGVTRGVECLLSKCKAEFKFQFHKKKKSGRLRI
jgi:hypothetical protein